MMKKLMATLLAGVMLFSFAGCGEKTEVDNGEVVTLRWLVPGDKQADLQSVLDEANKILVEKIGAKLDLQFIDNGAFQERMNMYMASGDDYDLAFTGYCNTYSKAVLNEALYPMTDLINEHAPDLWDALPEYMWDFAKIKGEIYSVPNTQVCSQPIAIAVNKEVCDKYNFDYSTVKTIEDLEPMLEVIKQNEPGIYPYKPYHREYMWTYGIYEDTGAGTVVRCDGSSSEVLFSYETPEWKRGREKFIEWHEKGYIRADVDTCGDDTADKMAGRYAFESMNYKPGSEAILKNERGREYDIIRLGKGYMPYSAGTSTMIGIGINSKHPEKAIKLIELLNTDNDFYNLICFGIEGKHYNLNEEGKVEFIDGSGYVMPNAAWKFGNQFNALISDGQDMDVWEKTMKMDDEAIKSPLIGFFLDTDSIKTEIAQISAISKELERAYTEEAYNAYIEKANLAGREKIRAEVQKQVDAFLASK